MHRELESLVSLFNHACKVVHPGWTLLCRMFDLLSSTGSFAARHPHHHIWLNQEFRADLAWWQLFTKSWNGVGLLGSYDSDVRCLRGMGLWCLVWDELVPVPLG